MVELRGTLKSGRNQSRELTLMQVQVLSIPTYPELAQLAGRLFWGQEVVCSNHTFWTRSRSRAAVARQAHILEVGGSIPPSATK